MSAPQDPVRVIVTDGSAQIGGHGGYAAMCIDPHGASQPYVRRGRRRRGPANAMELTAATHGQREAPKGARVVLISDSRYLIENAQGQRRRLGGSTGAQPGAGYDAKARNEALGWTQVRRSR